MKKEMQEYPTLDGQDEFAKAREEKEKAAAIAKVEEQKQKEEEPTLGSLQTQGGGGKKGKRNKGGKGGNEVVKVKLGFF
jgi:hypothetical protein